MQLMQARFFASKANQAPPPSGAFLWLKRTGKVEAMPDLVIRVDTREVEKALRLASSQIPFATAVAINGVARAVREQERQAMGEVFARPKPFTKNSVFMAGATKADPTATVFVRPEAAKYLLPYEIGGVHELPGKALLNPKHVRLDAYGQLRQGQFKTLAQKPGDFVGTVHGVTGLWQRPATTPGRRRGKAASQRRPRRPLKLLVRFGQALEVKKHLDFVQRAQAIAGRALPMALEAALQKTIATMNRQGR
jgi:hypothetical protein